MKITLSAASLLLAANLPYVFRLVRHRHQLPKNWASGLLIVLRYRLLSGLHFATLLAVLPFAALYYVSIHLKPIPLVSFVAKCLLFWAYLCLINLLAFIVFFGHKTAYFLHIHDWPVWVYKLRRWWRMNRNDLLTKIRHRALLLLFFLAIVFLLNVLP